LTDSGRNYKVLIQRLGHVAAGTSPLKAGY